MINESDVVSCPNKHSDEFIFTKPLSIVHCQLSIVHYLCSMKLLYPLLFLLTTLSLSAQLKEFHITEREPDGTSVVQANTDYPDNAMILVYSDLQELDFRSSVGAINQQRYNARANRYEILLSPQRQILFVAARGFIEQRIALINPSPKQVFYYQVEERSGQDEISVFFNVEPKDAKLFIDNVPTDINKTVSVPLGTVNVRLEREGYRPIAQALVTSPEKVNFEFRMREVEPEIVNIITNEKDARVIIDGQERGLTDVAKRYSLFLYPGDYTVEVQKSGYLTHSQTISVAEESDNDFRFRIEKNTGIIAFDVEPRNATISLNKSSIGSERSIERTPGRYRIDVELPDHEPHSETIDLARGVRKTIRAVLEPHSGSLQFSVSPSNAQVVLKDGNGKEVKRWEGLQLVRDLPVGEYEVEAALSGYITQTKTLRITKDERVSVEVALEKGQLIPPAIQALEENMVFVKGGSSIMGCTSEQGGDCSHEKEKPTHQVWVSDYWIGKFEITVAQFAAFVDATGYITDAEKEDGSFMIYKDKWEKHSWVNWRYDVNGNYHPEKEYNHPVKHVSWNDVQAFCNWLSEITKMEYRLPTEAEWEFAARGGNKTHHYKFSGGYLSNVGWYKENSNNKTHPVGSKRSNELGLYDMSGHVWEWCLDWYSMYTSDSKDNPRGPKNGTERLMRGGGFNSSLNYCRNSYRTSNLPNERFLDGGFRVVVSK